MRKREPRKYRQPNDRRYDLPGLWQRGPTMSVEDGINKTLRGLSEIADDGGYHERVDALETVAKMSWFDNFGIEYYNLRVRVTKTLIAGVNAEDIPEIVKEEFPDEVDA